MRPDSRRQRMITTLIVSGRLVIAGLLVMAGIGGGQPLSAAAKDNPQYVLGVFPHLPPRDLEKVFAPMAADLGKAVNADIRLRTSTTFDRFAALLRKQEFDIAFVQPFDYVGVASKLGYLPLATRTEKLSAIVVTRSDSPLKSLADLKNRKVALPPKTAAVSHLFIGHLRANGLRPEKDVDLVHFRSHVSCMQQVLIGDVAACATAAPALRFFQAKMQIELKIIASTREIPHTLFIIHPRIPKATREAIQTRIVGWANTREGQELLGRGKLTPFIPIKDSDYNIVREMAR